MEKIKSFRLENSFRYRIIWNLVFLIFLIISHKTNPNPQLLDNWLKYSKEILSGHIPSDNWYGPSAGILMLPFVWVKDVFFVTVFYSLLGANIFWEITKSIERVIYRGLTRVLLLSNIYLFRLLDSSGDTVFEFFLLNCFCLAIIRRKWFFFHFFGIFLGELRSTYWIIYIGISLVYFLAKKIEFRKRNHFLFGIPAFISVILLNGFFYGVYSTAGEGGYTAYFTNNKYSYMTGNSFMVDHFAMGGPGPMDTRCDNTQTCSDHELFIKTIKENLRNPEAFGFNLLQKTSIYFFEPQKVPRIPGKFTLNTEKSVIEIGQQRLTTLNFIASFQYFVYRSLILILFWSLMALCVFNRKLFFLLLKQNSLFPLLLPWLFGSITGILFVAETRLWIVMELMMIPFLMSSIPFVKNQLKSIQL
jgi:hypothetical protein